MKELEKMLDEEFCFNFALRDDLEDTKDLFFPTQAEPNATGYDVRAAPKDRKDIILRPGHFFKIPLGFRSFCPPGWYYQLHPRSSTFTKKYCHNLIGVVDESWEGETLIAGQYIPDLNSLGTDLVIKFGDAIGQIIPMRRESINFKKTSNQDIDKLFAKRQFNRKTGGFGSTG